MKTFVNSKGVAKGDYIGSSQDSLMREVEKKYLEVVRSEVDDLVMKLEELSELTLENKENARHEMFVREISELAKRTARLLSDVLFIRVENLDIDEGIFQLDDVIRRVMSLIKLDDQNAGKLLNYHKGREIHEYLKVDEGKLFSILFNLIEDVARKTNGSRISISPKILKVDNERYTIKIDVMVDGISGAQSNVPLLKLIEEDDEVIFVNKLLTNIGGYLEEIDSTEKNKVTVVLKLNKANELSTNLDSEFFEDFLSNNAGINLLVANKSSKPSHTILRNLEALKIKIDYVTEGQEAVTKVLSDKRYHVVFMGLEMPIKDGLSATTDIRNLFSKEDLPIIGLIDDLLESDYEKAFNAGMNDLLQTPLNEEQILNEIKKYYRVKYRSLESSLTMKEKEDHVVRVDVEKGLMYHNNSLELYHEMLNKFNDMFKNFEETYYNELKQEKYADLERRLHTLKGLASGLGAQQLAEISKTIELNIKNNYSDTSLSKQLFSELNGVLSTIPLITINKQIIVDNEKEHGNLDEFISLIDDLNVAAELSVFTDASMIVEKLNLKKWQGKEAELLSRLHKPLDTFDFPEIIRLIEEYQIFLEI